MSAAPDARPRTLIDELLAEQRRLTPVDRFTREHEHGDVPAQARYYGELIPESKPGAGQQYAFAVDLDACTGCKACVSACHSLNGLDEHETWRSVGLIHGGTVEQPYQQTVTTACHHCVEPGCLEGCPVGAYEKDSDTGIVRHLDDQCIGCQYCVLKCPYDVPRYSERLGIVRKCDMCIGRLLAGEAPACVQACPHEAISIAIVEHSAVMRASTSGATMLPGAFDSSYTKPTTRFASRRSTPGNLRPADADALRLEQAHWPLVFMLLLTQTAAGLFAILTFAIITNGAVLVLRGIASAAWLSLHAGLAISVLHLGRPKGAWRFFLGLRTSWMSREILAFGIFSLFATLATAMTWFGAEKTLLLPLNSLSAIAGALGIFASGMTYVDTRRPFWSGNLVFPKFFGTSLLLGSTTVAALLAAMGSGGVSARAAVIVALIIRTIIFAWATITAQRARTHSSHPAHGSQLIMMRHLPWIPAARVALFCTSNLGGILAIATANVFAAAISFSSTFAAQVLERYSFFTTCPAPRMPGGVPS